jgi:hypothetical protein
MLFLSPGPNEKGKGIMTRELSYLALGVFFLTGGQAEAQSQRVTAASLPIPSMAPQGNLHVMALGVERLAVPVGMPDSYLHVELALDNTTDTQPWTMSTSEQMVAIGGLSVGPTFARTSAGSSVLQVGANSHGTIDLYFPVTGQQPVVFNVNWRLHRGNEVITQAATFQAPASTMPESYQPLPAPDLMVTMAPVWTTVVVAPRPAPIHVVYRPAFAPPPPPFRPVVVRARF